MTKVLSNPGFCHVCDQDVTFSSDGIWLREEYLCESCGSIPRERALMFCMERYYPQWRTLQIHESSPGDRGASLKLKHQCPGYLGTHFFPGLSTGQIHRGWRNEDLEQQTFADESFDLVVTQDVMEHIFDPASAFREIARTLKPGGAHIATVPLINQGKPSERCAIRDAQGEINYLRTPEYHGNPVDAQGALVTMRWGYDICDFILKHSGLYTTIFYIDNLSLGIRAEYIEVLVSHKL